jgi:hypothetical protein
MLPSLFGGGMLLPNESRRMSRDQILTLAVLGCLIALFLWAALRFGRTAGAARFDRRRGRANR